MFYAFRGGFVLVSSLEMNEFVDISIKEATHRCIQSIILLFARMDTHNFSVVPFARPEVFSELAPNLMYGDFCFGASAAGDRCNRSTSA